MTTVRRVRRIIRKIDPWTVLKVSASLNVVAALGIVLGLVMFWSVLTAAGIPDRIIDVLVEDHTPRGGREPLRQHRTVPPGRRVWLDGVGRPHRPD